MTDTYVLLDAMGIQKYVFQTTTLRIIIGGSLALARWQEACREEATKCGGEIIASAGGNVLARFPDSGRSTDFRLAGTKDLARFADPDPAQTFIRTCLREPPAPPDMEIAWARVPDQGDDEVLDQDRDVDIWDALQRKIAWYKAGDRPAGDYPVRQAGLPGCLHCGVRPEEKGVKVDNRVTCQVCHKRHDLGESLQRIDLGDPAPTTLEKLYQIPLAQGLPDTYPTDLEDLVTFGEKKDWKVPLAVVVIDLNNMGRRIKAEVKEKGFAGLQTFSEKLEQDVYDVLERAIVSIGQRRDGISPGQFLRLRPLLVGGDDLVLAMPAPFWPQFVADVLTGFQEKGHHACAGVVVAKYAYPITRLAQMAEELTANAKALVRASGRDDCAVDWHTHQESAFTGPLEARRKNFTRNVDASTWEVATGRPYTLDKFRDIKDQAEELRRGQWSQRKEYALYQALRAGTKDTRDALVHTFLRGENEELDKYDYIWKRLGASPDQAPLWLPRTIESGKKTSEMFHTELPDILEIKWLLADPEGSDE